MHILTSDMTTENIICQTCSQHMSSYVDYHNHNITCHSLTQLSLTLLNICGCPDFLPCENITEIGLIDTTDGETTNNNPLKMCKQVERAALRTECMDEVIELGHREGFEDLSVQSLFLKSNASPFVSSKVIDLGEISMNSCKIDQRRKNQIYVHFSKTDNIISVGQKRNNPMEKLEKSPGKECILIKSNTQMHKRERSNSFNRSKINKKLCKKYAPSGTLQDKVLQNNASTKDGPKNIMLSQKNNEISKVVLRSGRAIKSRQKDNNFIYFDKKSVEVGKNGHSKRAKVKVKNREEVNPLGSDGALSFQSQLNPECQPFPRLTDFLSSDLGLTDFNIDDELDISVENLDMEAFSGLDNMLPENQILTVENLLQELEGGGSIEISNITKENNTESETIVVNDLGLSCKSRYDNKCKDILQPSTELKELQTVDKVTQKYLSKSAMKNLACKLCKKKYVSGTSFLLHIKKYHDDRLWMHYKCGLCNKMFGFLAALERHMLEHNKNQRFVCEVCGKHFKQLQNLKIHFSGHLKIEGYKCPQCPKKYFLEYSLRKHLKLHENTTLLQCDLCSAVFRNNYALKTHKDKHGKSKYLGLSTDLKCNYCGDVQPKSNFADSTTHHLCPCQKGFYKQFLLENPNFTESSPKVNAELKQDCLVCGNSYVNLHKHMKDKSNPVVSCTVCDAKVRKRCLSSHMLRRHHSKPVECDHCFKVFKHPLALKEHLNYVKRKEAAVNVGRVG